MIETRQDERCERYEINTHWPHSDAEIIIEHRGGERQTLTLRAEWPVGDINDLMDPLMTCVRQAVAEAEPAEMHKSAEPLAVTSAPKHHGSPHAAGGLQVIAHTAFQFTARQVPTHQSRN